MRICLARAIFLSDIIIIDSDLTSLDKNTRNRVLNNLSVLADRKQTCKTFFIKCKGIKNDEALSKKVYQVIKDGKGVKN